MRVTSISLLVIVFVFCIQTIKAQKGQLTLQNTIKTERKDELIVLSRQELVRKLGRIGAQQFVTVVYNQKPIVVQYDDLTRDGIWDELAFLQSFKPAEKITVQLFLSNTPAAIKAVVRAHARHKRKNADDSFGNDLQKDSIPAGQPATDFTKQAYPPFLTEGPAWENDKVGFRLYFDVRNGKDIWGKTTTQMMMDEVGLDTAKNYHAQADWGMDILKVGKSLGAGALALSVPMENGKDSLIRLGGMNRGNVVYEKVADGPVRAIIRFHYPQWKLTESLKPVSLTEEISIWGGQYFYESKVTLKGAPANAKLVTGIVNLHSTKACHADAAKQKILYTFDRQSENKDELGLGIIVPAKIFNSYYTVPNEKTDIQNTYAVRLKGSAAMPAVFRFYAGWSKSSDIFLTEKGFAEFLKTQVLSWSNEIKVKSR